LLAATIVRADSSSKRSSPIHVGYGPKLRER
jgi:hypothetical protein